MSPFKKSGPLIAVAAVTWALAAAPALAKTGSYTITKENSKAEKVRITARAEDGTTYDQTFTFSGAETDEQVRNTIKTDLEGAGWGVTDNGSNGITITGHGTSPIEKVDGGSNKSKGFVVNLDGNVITHRVLPNSKYKVSLDPEGDPDFLAVEGEGVLVCISNGHEMMMQTLPGMTPEIVTDLMFEAFLADGWCVERSGPMTIDILCDPGDAEYPGYFEWQHSGGGLHLGLEIPRELSGIPATSTWGVGALSLALLTAAGWLIWRRLAAKPALSA